MSRGRSPSAPTTSASRSSEAPTDVVELRAVLGTRRPGDRRQDRDAPGGRRLRRDPRRRRRGDDRPRRPRRRDAIRGGAAHPEAARPAGARPRRAVDRRDPDARVDDGRSATDAGRGERRRQCRLRRRGRDHAERRDGDRRLPGAGRRGRRRGSPPCARPRAPAYLPAGCHDRPGPMPGRSPMRPSR